MFKEDVCNCEKRPLPVEAKSFVRKIGGPKSFLFQKDPWPTMMLSTVYRTVCKAFPIIQEKTNAESTTQQWRNDQGLRKCTHTCALSQTTAFETERVVISPEHQILYRQISIVFNVELYRNCFCMFLLYWPPTVFVSMFVRPLVQLCMYPWCPRFSQEQLAHTLNNMTLRRSVLRNLRDGSSVAPRREV